jgi:hypothetical protein
MKHLIAAIALALSPMLAASAADTTRKTFWEGTLHLGDNAAQFATVVSAGMAVQIPCVLDTEKKGKLIIVTRDIQTLAGEGHFAELLAHYEDDDGPAREYVVETFRLKGDSNNVDVEHMFGFDPLKKLYAKPAYHSLRIKVDTQIKFKLWDDFLLKRIEVEQ